MDKDSISSAEIVAISAVLALAIVPALYSADNHTHAEDGTVVEHDNEKDEFFSFGVPDDVENSSSQGFTAQLPSLAHDPTDDLADTESVVSPSVVTPPPVSPVTVPLVNDHGDSVEIIAPTRPKIEAKPAPKPDPKPIPKYEKPNKAPKKYKKPEKVAPPIRSEIRRNFAPAPAPAPQAKSNKGNGKNKVTPHKETHIKGKGNVNKNPKATSKSNPNKGPGNNNGNQNNQKPEKQKKSK